MNAKFLPYLFLLLFAIISFSLISSYGISWDEPIQHKIGLQALSQIMGGPRVNIARTDAIYYGPAFEIFSQFVSVTIINIFNISYITAHHIPILLITIIGLLYFYKFTLKLFNFRIATIALTLLCLSPIFTAQANFNSKDMPIASLSILVLYNLVEFVTTKKWRHIFLSGVFYGLAIATRADALIILPMFMIAFTISKKPKIEYIKPFLIFAVTTLATIFISWPNLWSNPLLIFLVPFRLASAGAPTLFAGHVLMNNDVPAIYTVFFVFVSQSIVIWCLALIGFIILLKNFKKTKNLPSPLVLSYFFLPILVALLPGAARYDGARHYLTTFPPLMIIAAVGSDYLYRYAKSRGNEILAIFVGLLIFIYLSFKLATLFPYGNSYFNEVAQLIIPNHIEKQYEIEYWGTPYKEGLSFLNRNVRPGSVICVPVAGFLLGYYDNPNHLIFRCNRTVDYTMFISRYSFIPLDLQNLTSKLTPIFKISRENSDLLYIYDLRGIFR